MAGIMYLGNQMVSPVIVKSEHVGRKIIDGGKLECVTDVIFSMPPEIHDVGSNACQYLFNDVEIAGIDDSSLTQVSGDNAFNSAFQSALKNTTVHFRNITTVTGNGAFAYAFRNCENSEVYFDSLKTINADRAFTGFGISENDSGGEGPPSLKSAHFDELEEINGNNVFSGGFMYNNLVEKIEFKKLKKITGNSVFYGFCEDSESLKEFILDAVEEIGDDYSTTVPGTFAWAVSSCKNLEKISFNSLKIVGRNVFKYFVGNGTYEKLNTFNVPSVETAKEGAFSDVFSNNWGDVSTIQNLTYISFDSLKNIQYPNVLKHFAPESLKLLIFKSLNENSFGDYTNQFSNMLGETNGCTVYFPTELESVIGNWSDVIAGFGGTNTSIIFSLPMFLEIITNPSTAITVSNNFRTGSKYIIDDNTTNFVIKDEESYKNVLYIFTNYTPNEEETVNVDLDDYTYVKITIKDSLQTTGQKLLWNGLELSLQEETEGVYSTYVNNVVGATLTYQNNGTIEYRAVNQSFETTGNDLTITITPEERQERAFTRPNLTSSGTIGGNSFAVYASENNATAYQAVDSSTSTYWQSYYNGSPTYTIYNPYLLSISKLVFTWYSSSYRATKIVVYASNDNENWENLGEFNTTSSSSYTLNLTDVGFYKYYKFAFTRSGAYVEIKNITITATEKY